MSEVNVIGTLNAFAIKFEWQIDNFFSRLKKDSKPYTSPDFTVRDATWYLQLRPDSLLPAYVFWDVCLSTKNIRMTKQYAVSCEINIKKCDGSMYICRQFFDDTKDNGNQYLSFYTNIQQIEEEKAIFAPCDVLTVHFTVNVPEGIQNVSALSVSKNFKDIFLSGENSDVTIKVKNKEFLAHRLVLSTRCPVFASMFQHDMVEKTTGVVNIVDSEPDAFREFLLFLYSGEVENISSHNAVDLYCIAEKYGLMELKMQCVAFMILNISVDNFCDIIIIALRYNEENIINCATEFFINNAKEIIVTTNWIEFAKENTVQANELFIKLLHEN